METNDLKNKFTKESNLNVWAEYCCENQSSSYKDSFVAFLLLETQLLSAKIDELREQLLLNIEGKAYYRKKFEILEDEFITKTK